MINCRGRNGWFKLNRFRIQGNSQCGNNQVSFYSKTIGNTPPIIFLGTDEKELIILFKDILNKLKGGDTKC